MCLSQENSTNSKQTWWQYVKSMDMFGRYVCLVTVWQCRHVVMCWWRHCVLWSHHITASHDHSHTDTAYCSIVTSVIVTLVMWPIFVSRKCPEKAPTRTLLKRFNSESTYYDTIPLLLRVLSIAALPMHHGPSTSVNVRALDQWERGTLIKLSTNCALHQWQPAAVIRWICNEEYLFLVLTNCGLGRALAGG